MKNQPTILCRIALLSAFVLLLPGQASSRTITVGSVGTRPASEIKIFLPLANYLSEQLQADGVTQGQVVIAKDIAEMASLFRDGKVDIFIDSSGRSLALSRLVESKPLLRRWKKGTAEYHGLIFTKKDNAISRLEDLKGKIVAFEAPLSVTGCLLPKMILMEKGLKVVSASTAVRADEVGYLFSDHDENTMVWVMKEKVSAGVIDNQSYLREARTNSDRLKIIDKTPSVPRHIVSFRARLPSTLVNRIKETLIQMDRSEEGRKILEHFEKTTKFDELTDQAWSPLMKLGKLIDAELKHR
jgi:phosphonate transport system substrate-binding protein